MADERALARVDLGAVTRNCERLGAALTDGAGLCAVVKADGYGHGAGPCARAALEGGATWLAVATAHEAMQLRDEGIDTRVLVMGALTPADAHLALQAEADVVAWREAFARKLVEWAEGRFAKVHVKLDTGMGRLGTRDPEEAVRVAEAVAEEDRLELAGLMTHFATADEIGDEHFPRQLERFTAFVERLRPQHPEAIVHAANSAATLREPASHFTMVRCGIAIYGLDPFNSDPAEHGLEPALSLSSYAGRVERFEAGAGAGYGQTWHAAEATTVATLPIGYGDGWRRGLSNNAEVLIGGRRRPLVGTVSMDNVTVDLGPEADVATGEPAVLIGAQGDERILCEEVAQRLGTINYEVTCGLSARVPPGPRAMTRLEELAGHEATRAAREVLDPEGVEAWIVGGTIRDALLGRPLHDLDLAVRGDAEGLARRLAKAVKGPVFALSETFGAWRVEDRKRGVTFDLTPFQGEDIETDLAQRELTINAMALPLAGGELVDPFGGRLDLDAGTLRLVSEDALRRDPLRTLRLPRFAAELGFSADPEAEAAAARHAASVTEAAPERIWAELRHLVCADGVLAGLALAERTGVLAQVLPELAALHSIEQSRYHHLDVYDHSVEVLARLLELERDLPAVFGDLAPEIEAVLGETLADELTRGQALRFAALLHDVGKPATRGERPDGRVTFMGHDRTGGEMVHAICRRLRASSRLASFLGAVTRHHLVLGFLVHERPLSRRDVYRYLRQVDPVEVEVTVLTCADRLATRGRNAEPAIAAHLEVARELMGPALEWRAQGPPRAPLPGDELAREVGIDPGPELGELLRQLEEAAYAGEVEDREAAVELARQLRKDAPRR